MLRKVTILFFCVCLILVFKALGQDNSESNDFWSVTNRESIIWDLTKEERLPHGGNIEMSGKNVSAIIYYELDENKYLTLKKDLIFPQLRTFNKTNEPAWKKYRAYFRRVIADQANATISIKNELIVPGPIDSVEIAGKLIFYHQAIRGLRIKRTIYPSMEDRLLVEKWELMNVTDERLDVVLSNSRMSLAESGYKGNYRLEGFSMADSNIALLPSESYTFPVYYGALLNDENPANFNWSKAEKERDAFLTKMKEQLVFESPNEAINQLFYFSKIRAAESIFNSQMGLVHSPGGGNYYAGIWANDQIEYSGPFFPYLGYESGNQAAHNAYKWFLKKKPQDYSNIAYAFEVDGIFEMNHLDRGDAAMIAYGTSKYLLALGDIEKANELWPLITWSLEYCRLKKNAAGAVASESDEMEGRIATGSANLSTSSLYYGGLKFASYLAKELGMKKLARNYERQQKEMAQVIETYFGANIEGLDTYQYFDGNQYLRHWICLPLTMGIFNRKEGTIDALFNKLWTDNGVLVELNKETKEEPIFWDRATLYTFRGAMKAGATDFTIDRLLAFSRKRLLGDHVPYVIEAYPENNKKHLSAESALYCRVITEGLFGLEPIGFDQILLSPRLPKTWDHVDLKNVALMNKSTDLLLSRENGKLRLKVISNEKIIYDQLIDEGQEIALRLN